MTTQQRRTIRYKGVKVRYTHKYIRENGFSYTTTDLDEENLRRVRKAYEKYLDRMAVRLIRKGYSLMKVFHITWKVYGKHLREEFPFLAIAQDKLKQIKEQNESERL
jgi:hypothetical protein